jgi:hypothetical protein
MHSYPLRGLDAWITGNYGYDAPGNELCPRCHDDVDAHCSECGACLEGGDYCERCAMTCEYCGDESETVRGYEWIDDRGRTRVDRACVFCAIGNDLIMEG